MSDWKNFSVWSSNKIAETDKSYLFTFPSADGMKGYRFWHNKKLCHETKNPKFMNLGYTDNSEFRVFRQEKRGGKYVTVDEKVLTGDQMKKAFADCNKPFEKKTEKKEPVVDEPVIASDDLPFVGDDNELDF